MGADCGGVGGEQQDDGDVSITVVLTYQSMSMLSPQISNAKQWERTAAAQAAAAGSRLALAAGAGARGFMNMVQSGRRSSRGSIDGGKASADAEVQVGV